MRKTFSLFFLVIFLLCLLSCQKRQDDGYRFLIGVSLANLSEPWRIAMYREIETAASKLQDVRFIYTDSGDSIVKQTMDVDRLLSCGIDLLIMSPVDAVSLESTVRKAYRSIPLILIDRAVDGYDFTLFIGPDNRQIGREAGALVRELLLPDGGSVIELQGRSDSLPTIERDAGFRESLKDGKNFRITALHCDWLRDSAQDVLAANLDPSFPPDLVFAHNDAMAYGATLALRQAKVTGRTRIVGVDGFSGTGGGLEMVEDGIIDATFLCPTGGKDAVRFAMDILGKEEGIPKKVILRSRLVSKQNLSEIINPKPRNNPRPSSAILFGFSQTGKESDWRAANTASIKKAAADFGIQLVFREADLNQSLQIEAIREFIRLGVDVIAFSPLVETGWDEVLGEARDAGIPVICSDRTVKTEDQNLFSTFIGGDFTEEGRRAARWLVNETRDRQDVRIFELRGTEGSGPAIERRKGFADILQGKPGFSIIRSEMGDFKRSEGYRLTKSLLNEEGLIFDVIYAHNDDMALGAIQALEESGFHPGTQILIVSVDAVKAAFKAMQEGKLNCTVECSPLLGPQLMKAVRDYMDGKDLPLRIITDERIFPANTAKANIKGRKY